MALSFVELEMELVSASPSPRQPAHATEHAGFFGLIWPAKTDCGDRWAWVVEAGQVEVGFGLETDVSAAQRQIAAVIYRCAGDGSVLIH